MSAAPLVEPHWCDEVEVDRWRDDTTSRLRSRRRNVEGVFAVATGKWLDQPAAVFIEEVHYDWDGDDASTEPEPDEQPMIALVLDPDDGPWKMSPHTAQVLAEELLNAAALLDGAGQ